MPVPDYFVTTAGDALNLMLQKMFTHETIDVGRVREVVGEISNWNITLNCVALEFIIRRRLERTMYALQEDRSNSRRFSDLLVLVEAILLLPVEVNLWQAQNMYWSLFHLFIAAPSPTLVETNEGESIITLGTILRFNMPALRGAARETP